MYSTWQETKLRQIRWASSWAWYDTITTEKRRLKIKYKTTWGNIKKGKTGECLHIELFTWKMPHLYLFLCKKKAKALRFGICHSLPIKNRWIFVRHNKIRFLYVWGFASFSFYLLCTYVLFSLGRKNSLRLWLQYLM